MQITGLDHLVLTVASISETCRFYTKVLGMQRQAFGGGRVALKFGRQKINLHKAGSEFEPKAKTPLPGSGDLCFICDDLARAMAHLEKHKVEIIEGPVRRTGANGPLLSVYIRDPDGNLIEVSAYE